MAGTERTSGRTADRDRDVDAAPTPAAGVEQAARPLLDGVDGLLDEIDAVLEDNAEEFVRGYVQKGGQ
jgi:prokaryotic ubiquitin-like protein Pup